MNKIKKSVCICSICVICVPNQINKSTNQQPPNHQPTKAALETALVIEL